MIPLVDLRAQFARVKDEALKAVENTLVTGAYILGPEVAEFEKEFATYCEASYAAGVNNGTNAIYLALLAAGIGPGDEVITTPHTFIATIAAIRYTGAKPVLVDIDPVTYTIDPAAVDKAITPKTKAVVPVHIYGQPADMDAICAVAAEHNLTVIEDCAQAHGATYKGKRVGGIGRFGCFSFYPTKNLGACGEGGLVTCRDEAGIKKVRVLRDWGQEIKNRHELKGFNMRLEGIQGAVLRIKLRHLEEWTEERRAVAAYYDKGLAGLPVVAPQVRAHNRHVYHLYVIQAPRRDQFSKLLAERGVGTAVHYPIPVHLQGAHLDLGYRRGDFPVAEALCDKALSIPMYAELTREMQDQVIGAIKDVCTVLAE